MFVLANTRETVDGIGKCSKIEGTGHVAWTFVADNGQCRTLKLPCLCVPTMNGRIASMQEMLSACPNERFTMDGNNLLLSGHGAVPRPKLTRNAFDNCLD